MWTRRNPILFICHAQRPGAVAKRVQNHGAITSRASRRGLGQLFADAQPLKPGLTHRRFIPLLVDRPTPTTPATFPSVSAK